MVDAADSTGVSKLLGALYDTAAHPKSQADFLVALANAIEGSGHDLVAFWPVSPTTGDPKTVPLSGEAVGKVQLGPLTIVKAEPTDTQSWVVGQFPTVDGTPSARLTLIPSGTPTAPLMGGGDLANHIVRVLSMNTTLVNRLQRAEAAAGLLDAIPLGVLLANNGAQIQFTNHIGQEILDEKDGLFVERSYLTTPAPKDTNRLRKIIARVAAAGVTSARMPVGVLRIERPSFSRAWMIVVIPVAADFGAGSPMAALFVSDGERSPSVPPEIIEKMFALTPAESRLLVGLVDGYSLDEAAELYGVSKNTLRNQLNQVFRKTDTSKQSELVRLALTSPAPLLVNVTRAEPSKKT